MAICVIFWIPHISDITRYLSLSYFLLSAWSSLGASLWLQMALIRCYWSWDRQPTKALGVGASTAPLPQHKARFPPLSPCARPARRPSLSVSSGVTGQRYGPSGGVFLTLNVSACNAPGPERPWTLLKLTGCRPWQLTVERRVWGFPEGHSRASCPQSMWVCSAAVSTADCRCVFLQSVNPHSMFSKAKIISCYLKPLFIPAE